MSHDLTFARLIGAPPDEVFDAFTPVFVLTHRPQDVLVKGATTFTFVDELNIHLAPVVLGGGTRLFDDIGDQPIRLERIALTESPVTTHVRFRVLR